MTDPMETMRQGMIKLYDGGKLTDFTITCGSHTFQVHKVVLCAQSEYFLALPNFAEGETNSIDLKTIESCEDEDEKAACDDPNAIKLMVHFFYHLDYRADVVFVNPTLAPSTPKQGSKGKKGYDAMRQNPAMLRSLGTGRNAQPMTDGNMVTHARVFAAAVKYQIPALKILSSAKFKAAVDANSDHASFSEAARIAYTTTPEEIRDLREIVAVAIDGYPELLAKADVKKVVRSITDLTYSLLCKKYGVSQTVDKEGDVESGCAICEQCGTPVFLVECQKSFCSNEYRGCCHDACDRCETFG